MRSTVPTELVVDSQREGAQYHDFVCQPRSALAESFLRGIWKHRLGNSCELPEVHSPLVPSVLATEAGGLWLRVPKRMWALLQRPQLRQLLSQQCEEHGVSAVETEIQRGNLTGPSDSHAWMEVARQSSHLACAQRALPAATGPHVVVTAKRLAAGPGFGQQKPAK